MTNFLDDLERELRAAHPRRRRAARRAAIERTAQKAPAAVATVAVLGGATAFVVSTGSGSGADDGRAVHSATQTTQAARDEIAVLAGGTRQVAQARAAVDFLTPRHPAAYVRPVSTQGTGVPSAVHYTRGHEAQARALARELGIAWTRMTDRIRRAAPGARLALEVRGDIGGGRTVPLTDPAGRVQGSMTTLTINGRQRVELQSPIERAPNLAVWLRGEDRARFLGFVAEPKRPQADTLVVAELPEGDVWPELVVSREPDGELGDAPANVVLTARLGR